MSALQLDTNFKHITTVPMADIALSLSSSATSGVASIIPVDKITAKRQRKCMTMVMAEFLGKKRKPFLVLDSDPATNSKNYGARGAAVRGYLSFASKAQYFMTENNGQIYFLAEKFSQTLSELEEPVILFGFTYVLYDCVVREALKRDIRYSLPKGSLILHIGGWKKLAKENISRELFGADLEKIFSVPKNHHIDVYGFTEQMGLNYPDCACGYKHTPHLSRVIARDLTTHEVMPDGQPGLLEFISPLPHSYPGCAVLTDDIGVIVPGKCPYGRGGTRFKILGRQPKAEARGCGDIMGEKMRRPEKMKKNDPENNNLRLHIWGGQAKNLAETIAHVQKGQQWLESQPTEALIGLLAEVSNTWMDNPDLARWKYKGLTFLSRWCEADNLRALIRQALRGLDKALDEFTPEIERPHHLLRAKPLGSIAHWLSGNVPLLAMLVLVQCIITKNGNILKTASNNFDAMRTLLETFSGIKHTTSSGYTIQGDDLLRSLALVYFSHDDAQNAELLSMSSNGRIAWGGREAVNAICSFPAPAEGTDIILGPKTSFMVISREFLADETSANKLLRRAATDISSFDQTACSSPHTIFIEDDGNITPFEFARRLGTALERSLTLIPKEKESDAEIAAIQTARAIGDFYGYCWHSDGPGWSVLYDTRFELAEPVYSRFITARPVKDIMDIIPLIHKDVQTIGLAASGDKRINFAEAAAKRGVLRMPEIGLMTSFDSPWDGMFIMDRLVKWISLGGAASAIAKGQRMKK